MSRFLSIKCFDFMITTILLLVFLRQVLLYLQFNMVYFSFLVPFFILGVEFLRKKSYFNQGVDRIDSYFLGQKFVQYLLWLSMQVETWLSGKNFIVTFLTFFIIPALVYAYFYGLVFLTSSSPVPTFVQFLEVLVVIWLTFYIRLRSSYINYFNLGIDSVSVGWAELLSALKHKQNLSFDTYSFSKEPIVLASIGHSSYKRFREDLQTTYQTRGMWSAATAAGRGIRRLATENPGPTATFVVGALGAGVGLYGIKSTQDIERERLAFEKVKFGLQKAQFDLQKAQFDLQKAQFEFEVRKYEDSQKFSSSFSEPKSPAKVFFYENNSDRLVYLDTSPVESIFFL